ncbi:hypothetical protein [Novosphingobium sp.]|uniref:hypothetical protein n=1 Tax=Novosphingobium sp. TaxID=1874826 RepID=UPI0033403B31
MAMPGVPMADAPMPAMTMMDGALGSYTMMQDASGTAWQPVSTPMDGAMWGSGGWSGMVHGYANLIYDHQSGPRGGDKTFSESMVMVMAQRHAGPGTLTLKAMASLDPLMGNDGYPLLLQTGETADGVNHLVDRQHPHNLLMELAGTYAVPVGQQSSLFIYLGYPGEPALGPATFMHRFSGKDNPAAPISHHWLDSTHITFGVATAGFVHGPVKVEASVFNGREPDQHRWGWQPLRLDSWSGRITLNPGRDWSFQVSYGHLHSPEALNPAVNQNRLTASATYNHAFAGGNWQTTLAFGRNDDRPGTVLNAVLLESAVALRRLTVFARAETVQKDDLVEAPSPLAGRVFRVAATTLGAVYDVPVAPHLLLGIGVQATLNVVPAPLNVTYGSATPGGVMPFLRVKIR